MPASVVAAVAIGAAVGGFVQGLAGFAFGLIALGIWAWAIDPTLAGPLVVFGSLIGQLLSFGTVRHSMQVSVLLPFVAGGILGIPIGIALLHRIDPLAFKLVVGIILLTWCPTMLLARNLPRFTRVGRWADAVAGWLGGVMGGLGGLTGPAPTLWCSLRGWGRDTQRAVFQTFNLVMQTLTMIAYLASGTIGREAAWLFAIAVPAMIVPTLIGARLYRRFTDFGFQRLVLALLTASGGVLVVSSLSRLL
jgi:uncharacterized membrane protein YfcA